MNIPQLPCNPLAPDLVASDEQHRLAESPFQSPRCRSCLYHKCPFVKSYPLVFLILVQLLPCTNVQTNLAASSSFLQHSKTLIFRLKPSMSKESFLLQAYTRAVQRFASWRICVIRRLLVESIPLHLSISNI